MPKPQLSSERSEGHCWHLQDDLLLFLGARGPRGAPGVGTEHRKRWTPGCRISKSWQAEPAPPAPFPAPRAQPGLSQDSFSEQPVLCANGIGKLQIVSACPQCLFYSGWESFCLLLAQTETVTSAQRLLFQHWFCEAGTEIWWQRREQPHVPGAFPGSQALKMVQVLEFRKETRTL